MKGRCRLRARSEFQKSFLLGNILGYQEKWMIAKRLKSHLFQGKGSLNIRNLRFTYLPNYRSVTDEVTFISRLRQCEQMKFKLHLFP